MQEKELESMRRIIQQLSKSNENLTKERDVLKRELILEHRTAEKNDTLFQDSQHEIRLLNDAINIDVVKRKKLQDEISKITQEKKKRVEEVQALADKIDMLNSKCHP